MKGREDSEEKIRFLIKYIVSCYGCVNVREVFKGEERIKWKDIMEEYFVYIDSVYFNYL